MEMKAVKGHPVGTTLPEEEAETSPWGAVFLSQLTLLYLLMHI
jgi:hypothetical protein